RLDAVRSFLTLQPHLIDAKGPHGFTLHFHAQVGGKEAEPVLEYLQSIKKVELKPIPFLQKPPAGGTAGKPAKRGECGQAARVVPSLGRNRIARRQPTAFAYFRSVVSDGECRLFPPPASRRATAGVFVPMRTATSACVRPARRRACSNSSNRANS